jgi:hypothetical protein
MNVLVVTRIAEGLSLSHVMVGALMTGKGGEQIQAGPKQLKALAERGLVDLDEGVLTDLGNRAVAALEAEELSDELASELFPVTSTRYFVKANEAGDLEIRPFSEAQNGEVALSFVDAKDELIQYAISRRDFYRDLIKSTRSLRAKGVLGEDAEAEAEAESETADV